MSSGVSDNEKLSNLRSILGDGIPKARLLQVLEASNGSLEHAIEIYFHQQQNAFTNNASSREPVIESPNRISKDTTRTVVKKHDNDTAIIHNKKRSPTKLSSPDNKRGGAKQARLDSFFRKNQNTSTTLANTTSNVEFDKEQNKSRRSDAKISIDSGFLDSAQNTTNLLIQKPVSDVEAKPAGPKKTDRKHEADPASFLSFQRLCETLQEMSDTTKRLVKLKALETLIREIVNTPINTLARSRALSAALELVLGGSTPQPLNVSGSAVSKALQTSLGISRNQISGAYRKHGDIGDVAAQFFQKKTHFVIASKRRQLSVLDVTEGLTNISEIDGRDAKQHVLLTLLRGCDSKMECRFLVRLLIRNMRIGANIKTILAALAMAMGPIEENSSPSDTFKIDTKDAITMVQKTYDICPSIPKIVTALLEGGVEQMQRDCSIQVMTPIAPMLAHPIHSLDEIKNKMGDCGNEATMEWKYDGMRCQAHFDGSNFRLFSRHMLEMTDQFPEVAKFLTEALKKKDTIASFVIDAEIVGVEGQGSDSHLLPFQDLSTRRKKMDDGNGIRVKLFAFDIMLFNGKSLVNEELFERKARLHDLFEETIDFSFVFSRKLTCFDKNTIKTFLSEAIEHGAEGLMIKLLGKKTEIDVEQNNTTGAKPTQTMNSLYEAGTRSHSWLKVKRDYVAGYSDTIDVVPIGAWRGTGRKAQKSFLSPILLAVYDDEEDVYRSICRCMTFTDAMYESMREFYFNGTPYPACLDSTENSEQKLAVEDDASVEDDKSCDGQNNGSQKEEENRLGSNNEKLDECTYNEVERVNCFPNRPSSAFVITNESPPIWFKPMEVFEVAFADLSLSRQHTAAAGLVDEEGRGVALRFPRFKRRRPDKTPEQATTSIEVAQLFAKQSKIKNGSRSFQANRSK